MEFSETDLQKNQLNFMGIFGANFAKKTTGKKRTILLENSGKISLEIDPFCADLTSAFNVS